MMGEDILIGMLSAMESIYSEMIDLTSEMLSTASLMCGFAALLYVGKTLWSGWTDGVKLDIKKLVRPFYVGLLILFFPLFISTINVFLAPIEAVTLNLASSQTELLSQKIEEKFEAANNIREMTSDETISQNAISLANTNDSKKSFFSGFPLTGEAVTASLTGAVQKAALFILNLAFIAARMIISVLSVFSRIVLTVVAPFSLVFSLIPGFEGNISSWLGRYINVYLYIPISNILAAILGRLQVSSVDRAIASYENGSSMTLDSEDLFTIVFSMIGIYLYLSIPVIANWIIQPGGSNGSHAINSSMMTDAKSAGKSVAKLAGKFAGKTK